MNAVDTNVLVYAHDPEDTPRKATALDLVESLDDGVLVWQVACEYLEVQRRLSPKKRVPERAWRDIERLAGLWSVLYPSYAALSKARDLLSRFSLSFWDSLIVANCVLGGVHRIYTDDFDGYPKIDGVEVINPFKAS